MNKNLLTFFLFLVIGSLSAQQNFNLQNGPFQFNCGTGILYDSGGPSGPYSNNENITMVICPPLGSGQGIYLEVITNSLAPDGDILSLYDGGGITSPLISTIPQPDVPEFQAGAIFQTSVTNTEGCMTIVFNSNATGTGNFSFNIICGTKCQEIVSLVTPTPALTFDSTYNAEYINICLGDTFFASSSAIYPQNEISYIQNDASSNFVWNWGDNSDIDIAQVASHYFENPGGYVAQLSIFDVNGCRNYQDQILLIRVAPEPTFNTTWDSVICVGQTSNLLGLPEGTFENGVITGGTEYFIPPFYTGDTTFIPDGTGSSHTSSTFVTGFENNAVIENCGTIIEICMQLEHSYSGDLDIVLRCPNGQQVFLLDFPTGTGSTNFGEPFASAPVDGVTSDPTPGVPYEYCFSDFNNNFGTLRSTTGVNYTYTTVPSNLNGNTFTYTDTHFPEGTYLPEQPFSSLVGCPINGEWSIIFTDNLGADNGWIFNWTLDIHPCMYPDIDSFTMVYDLGFWDADPTIVATPNINEIVVQPTTPGSTTTYTYNVTDNFGCEYSNTYDVRVRDIYSETFGDTAVCIGDTVAIGLNILGSDAFSPAVCTYTVDMQDSWGDGWNGSRLFVIINGVSQTVTFTDTQGNPPGGRRILTFDVPFGETFTVTYDRNSGSFPTEQFYQILDPNGVIIFSAGSVPCFECSQDNEQNPIANGTTFTVTSNCGNGLFGPPIFTGIENVNDVDTLCELTLRRRDSWGDGWTTAAGTPNANVEVFVNGNSIGTYTVADQGLFLVPITENTTFTSPQISFGDEVRFVYNLVNTQFNGENSFFVLGATGNTLYSSPAGPANGTSFTVVLNESTCNISPANSVYYEINPFSTVIDQTYTGESYTANVEINSSTQYIITSNFSNGCILSDTVNVGLITFNYTLSNDTAVCVGDNVQLVAAGSDTYEWTINNETLNNPNIPNPIASPIETTVYYLVLDSAGCATIDSVQVVVNDLPTAEANNGQNPIEFCLGNSAELFATNNAGWSYNWVGPEIGSGSTINVTTQGSYVVIYTDLNGCSNSAQVNVVQLDTALFDFVGLRNILCCNDDEVSFDASNFITNGIDLTEIYWEGVLEAGDIIVLSAGTNLEETFLLNVVATNGCESALPLTFETRCIEPSIAPIDTIFSFTADTFNLTHNNNSTSTYTYQWTVDNTIAGEFSDANVMNPLFLASENEGIYTASVEVSGNYVLNDGNNYICIETAEELFEVVLVSEPKFPDAFTPNGDGDNDVFAPILDPLSTLTQFRVYNRWNVLVYEFTTGSNGWDGAFNGNAQAPDLYIYYIEIEKPDEKIIKQGTVTLIR